MRVPESLSSLAEYGLVEHVVRPLLSGKEADVFLVMAGGKLRVAKVYKDAQHRSFRQRAEYTEGRQTRNSRDARAMSKRSKYGRAQDEASWRNTEVDMIYRLQAAGVRVPAPWNYMDGVLLMDLVADAEGQPAPRLGETSLTPAEAARAFEQLLQEVVKMLCAGVVHGDLSPFNVLLSTEGPVLIDFPQSVDASTNQNARRLLLRDVDNLQQFLMQYEPHRRLRPYGQELWELFKNNELTPETRLLGRHQERARAAVDTGHALSLVREANRDERRRREALGLELRGTTEDRPAPRQNPAPERAPAPSRHGGGGPSRGPQGSTPRPQEAPQGGGPRSAPPRAEPRPAAPAQGPTGGGARAEQSGPPRRRRRRR